MFEIKANLHFNEREIQQAEYIESHQLLVLAVLAPSPEPRQKRQKLKVYNLKSNKLIMVSPSIPLSPFCFDTVYKKSLFFLDKNPSIISFPCFHKPQPLSSLPSDYYYKVVVSPLLNSYVLTGEFNGLYLIDLLQPNKVTQIELPWYQQKEQVVKNILILEERKWAALVFDGDNYIYICKGDFSELVTVIKECDRELHFYKNDMITILSADTQGRRLIAFTKKGRLYEFQLYKDDVTFLGGLMAESYVATKWINVISQIDNEGNEDFVQVMISAYDGKIIYDLKYKQLWGEVGSFMLGGSADLEFALPIKAKPDLFFYPIYRSNKLVLVLLRIKWRLSEYTPINKSLVDEKPILTMEGKIPRH